MMRDMKWLLKYKFAIIVGLISFLTLKRNFYFTTDIAKIFFLLLSVGLMWLYFDIKMRLKYFVIIPCIVVLLFINVWNLNSCLFMETLCLISLILIKIRENRKIPQDNVPSDKFSYYQSLGMTDSEIELFRSTMDKAQRDIKIWENNAKKSAKLKAIDMRTEGIKAAKSLFQELVRTPKRLSMANEFLNEHLDSINDLTTKYLTIDNHAIKSKETIKTLQNSIEVIEQVSLQIVKDYTNFVAEDIADMNADLALAKAKIQKKESYEHPSTDNINDILQADIDNQEV